MDGYTVAFAESLAEKLRATPVPDKATQKLNKQGVVRHLVPAIRELQGRGFTIEQIADSIRGEGFDITTPTLKSYLQRLQGKKAKRAAAKASSPATGAPVAAPTGERERQRPAASAVAADASAKKAVGETPSSEPKSTRSEFLDTDRTRL